MMVDKTSKKVVLEMAAFPWEQASFWVHEEIF
jgi:hypothetical protein